MISIVIPLYNKEKQIKNTLQSVFRQTFQDFEIVIINDGSTDCSVEVVKQINDSRIRLIEQKNQGVSVARNTGIKEVKYDYVALLDADDEWEPSYLETQVSLIRSFPEASVFACAYAFKYSNRIEPIILNKLPFSGERGILSNYFKVAACSHPPLWTSAVIVQKEALLKVGGFPAGVIEGEDLITWAKLAVLYPIAYNTTPQAYFVKDQAENYSNEMPRIRKETHNLGLQFEDLYKKHKTVVGLKDYVSHWYKMRAAMFLLSGNRQKSFRESIKSLQYNLSNVKVWVYLFLIPFPKSFILKIFRKFGHS
ncbi:glycosyltransferase family 2 protein [Bacteroidales bacterium OttesenSCG-928-A17]|nr:glycosyltransferase family 2 protein [Bacteroidales bacterium OttesenSCG-928-A17]